MKIIQVSSAEYSSIIPRPYHNFNQSSFNEVNAGNCDEVYYLLFKDKKYRLGIIGGKRKHEFHSPFSAPFGGFSFLSEGVSLKHIDLAISLLEVWCIENEFDKIIITLPPNIYNNTFISKQLNSLYRQKYRIKALDLNYHFENISIEHDYVNNIRPSARKFLKQSFGNNLVFDKCKNTNEESEAYQVICQNRSSRNFPLKMTFNDILKTDIHKDFFIIKNEEEVNVAAAIVYHISESSVQVVYWGDLLEYSQLRPMNYLSYKIFEYYNNQGIKFTDIGPSTEFSMPNYGLCEFKESIGCKVESKYLMVKEIK